MIDRRSFARSSLAVAGALVPAPAWLARLFGPAAQDPSPQDPAAPAPIAAAAAQAAREGKPLLVFVVPPALSSPRRGERIGAVLDGDADAALDVAMTVPVCATVAELQAALPACAIDGEPLGVVVHLVRGEGGALAVATVTAVVDPNPRFEMVGGLATDGAAVAHFAQRDRRLLADALHGAVLPQLDSLAQLAVAATAALDAAQRAALTAWLDGKAEALGGDDARDPVLVRAAAIVRSAAATLPAPRRDEVLAALAAAVARVVVQRSVPGSRWGRTSGCGVEFETPLPGDFGANVECGMGSVRRESRRFLQFLTRQ